MWPFNPTSCASGLGRLSQAERPHDEPGTNRIRPVFEVAVIVALIFLDHSDVVEVQRHDYQEAIQ
jgi:hypothetical protein